MYMCRVCGRPNVVDELTELHFCPDCDQIIAKLPQGRTYMLFSKSGVGKSVFLYKIIGLYLDNGKRCIYATFDEHPDQVRVAMSKFIKNLDVHEDKGLLSFIDCYSCIGGLKSSEKYYTSSPGDINGLNLVLTSMIGNISITEPVKVFLDSATSMFIHCEAESVQRFIFALSAKLKPRNGSLFFTLGEGAVAEVVQKRLEQIADGLIEFRLGEAGGRVRRYYRVSKVRGTMYFDSWLPFFIGKESIFLSPPDEPDAEKRFWEVFNLIAAQA
jgi:KaiC/GvpD/RAD55 family RecA-like ATPase